MASAKFSEGASLAAALATVLIGLEKSLLFREKWKFHLLMHSRLKSLQISSAIGQLDDQALAKSLSEIMVNYASSLPMQVRD